MPGNNPYRWNMLRIAIHRIKVKHTYLPGPTFGNFRKTDWMWHELSSAKLNIDLKSPLPSDMYNSLFHSIEGRHPVTLNKICGFVIPSAQAVLRITRNKILPWIVEHLRSIWNAEIPSTYCFHISCTHDFSKCSY